MVGFGNEKLSVTMEEVIGEWVIYITGETEYGIEKTEVDTYDNLRQILIFIKQTLKRQKEEDVHYQKK